MDCLLLASISAWRCQWRRATASFSTASVCVLANSGTCGTCSAAWRGKRRAALGAVAQSVLSRAFTNECAIGVPTFCHRTAHILATQYSLIVVEDLGVKNMTASARGTVEMPGTNVRQKAGLNRSILDKSWGRLRSALEWHGRKHGCEVVAVAAAYTSQTCSNCWHVASESRESQADFCCVACGFQANADVNAAKIVLALGLRVSGRGGLAVGPPMKRQPLVQEVARAAP
jgi:IS605 OrfB family transposase